MAKNYGKVKQNWGLEVGKSRVVGGEVDM